ncbi:MAG: endo-1,4-beta-xylanase [Planctomycetota bacterium]|nr:MAG: endo-1,4-beta-xylanase [Planctomycetota bacterium]
MQCVRILVAVLLMGSVLATERQEPSLAQHFADHFTIGMGVDVADLRDPAVWDLVLHHAAIITVENSMKPSPIQREPGQFSFARANRVVDAARNAGLKVHGHTLVWHRQTPDWMHVDAQDERIDRDQALERLHRHISTVMGHYRGRVESWDVINEVLADAPGDEDMRTDAPWYEIIGPDYVEQVFLMAAEADPDALLFYNDYNLETEPKRSRALRLVERVRAAGGRIDGIGIQAHLQIDTPSIEDIEASIRAFADAGLKVYITELDVSVHPWRQPGSELLPEDRGYEDGLSEETAQRLAQRYADLFALFVRHSDVIERVTFWNTHDGRSWLNYFPVQDRVDHPLLFDRQLQPKPAFSAVMEVLDR